MRLGLILSNDWEVFGDGSGDYFTVQHRPLEECLAVAANHGAKMTVMAEVGQQWGHKALAEKHAWAQEIADAWEEIVRETIRQGSDVQLHLHPQWLDAHYGEDGKWDLNLNKWAIGRVNPQEAEAALRQGRDYLESLLKPVDQEYACHAFRAGAYCIQPSSAVIDILLKLGFKCDTSVTKGMVDRDFFDYRGAYSNIVPWFVAPSTDVRYRTQTSQGLLEIPIYSFRMFDSLGTRAVLGNSKARNLFYRLNFGVSYEQADRRWTTERDRIRAERYPAQNRPFQSPTHKIKAILSSPRGIASAVLWPTSVQLDYDYVPANVAVEGVKRIFKSPVAKQWDDDVIIPLMTSGHVKNMHNADNLNRILDALNKTFGGRIVHWTLTDAIRYWTQPAHARLLNG